MTRRQGFTLVELLVVVAIIALLIAVLLPSLTKARELSRAAVCQAKLRSMVVGMMAYAMDHNGWFPPQAGTNQMAWHGWTSYLIGNAYQWGPPTYSYLQNQIPLAETVYLPGGYSNFYCPSRRIKRSGSHIGDYGMNMRMTYSDGENVAVGLFKDMQGRELAAAGSPVPGGNTYNQYNSRRTRSPAQMYLLADTRDEYAGWGRLSPLANSIREDLGSPYFTALGYEHLGVANMAFHDGHIETLRPETTPSWTYSNKSYPWFNGGTPSTLFPNDGIPR